MAFNKFSCYSLVINNELKTNSEYNEALQIIRDIETCKTIKQVKKVLKDNFGVLEDEKVHKIGTLGYLSFKKTQNYYKISIEYADEVHINVFPIEDKKIKVV